MGLLLFLNGVTLPADSDPREFGRTSYSQGKLTADDYGRDHHPRCFTIWLAGVGVKAGTTYETDEFSYNLVKDGVHVHDFHATLLHLLGIHHE